MIFKRFVMTQPEVVSIPMIKPPLDSVDEAIKNKSISQFKNSFNLLTNTCNNCHRATKHEFNIIQIPSTPLYLPIKDFRIFEMKQIIQTGKYQAT